MKGQVTMLEKVVMIILAVVVVVVLVYSSKEVVPQVTQMIAKFFSGSASLGSVVV